MSTVTKRELETATFNANMKAFSVATCASFSSGADSLTRMLEERKDHLASIDAKIIDDTIVTLKFMGMFVARDIRLLDDQPVIDVLKKLADRIRVDWINTREISIVRVADTLDDLLWCNERLVSLNINIKEASKKKRSWFSV